MQPTIDVLEKFAGKFTITPSGCWEFKVKRVTYYGSFGYDGRTYPAHRWLWQLVHNKRLAKREYCNHLCKNKACCNPQHIEIVTPRENSIRDGGWAAKHARKTHCPQRHPYSTENTYRYPNGRRECRKCRLEYIRSFRKREAFKEAVKATLKKGEK